MSNSRIEPEAMLSRQHIKAMITAGHCIVIAEQNVLKLDSWLDRHLGGIKVIEYGREGRYGRGECVGSRLVPNCDMNHPLT